MVKVKRPESLRECLELVSKLHSSSEQAKSACNLLEKKLKLYFPDSKCETDLTKILQNIDGVYKTICSTTSESSAYKSLNVENVDCEEILDFLVEFLPIILSMLSFLYFQLCEDYKDYGGGKWKNGDGDGGSSGGGGSDAEVAQLLKPQEAFKKWLEDGLSPAHKGFMKRGFKSESFQIKNCQDLTANLKACCNESKGRYFEYPRCGLFFLCKTWHHSMLADALLFLEQFCKTINEKSTFNKSLKEACTPEDYEAIKEICTVASENLEHMSEFLTAMPKRPEDGKSMELSDKAIRYYIMWLKVNLRVVVISIKKLRKESWKWNGANFHMAKSHGPFKYGFVFNKCNKKQEEKKEEKCKTEEEEEEEEEEDNKKDYVTALDMVGLQIALSALTSSSHEMDPESLRDLEFYVQNVKFAAKTFTNLVMSFLGAAGVLASFAFLLNIIGYVDAFKLIIDFPMRVKGFFIKTRMYWGKLISVLSKKHVVTVH